MQDECSSPKMLYKPFRSVFLKSPGCTIIDMYLLRGWYKFIGSAGNMMLNYCPSQYGVKDYNCGTEKKGWMSGSLPKQSDGIVSRYVNGNLKLDDMGK